MNLSMFKTVVLLNIFVETVIYFILAFFDMQVQKFKQKSFVMFFHFLYIYSVHTREVMLLINKKVFYKYHQLLIQNLIFEE